MATNEGLSLKIGATVDALRKGMAEAKAIIKGTTDEIGRESTAVDNAAKSWNQMGKFIFQQTYERKRLIQQVQQGIGTWKLEASAIEQVGSQAMPALQKGSRGASTALMGLTRIAQDAPFGFIAIGNNISETVSQMGHLIKTSGGVGGAFKAIGQSIIGPGGVVLGLNLLITGITVAVQKYGSLGAAINALLSPLNEQQKLQKLVSDSIVKGQQNAQSELARLDTLYDATQNVNISLSERNKIVDELQKKYPKYFGDLSNEAVLAGKAAGKYNDLKDAILAAAVARSLEDDVAEQGKALVKLQTEEKKITEERLAAAGKLRNVNTKARKEATAVAQATGLGGVDYTREQVDLDNLTNSLRKNANEQGRILETIKSLREQAKQVVETFGAAAVIGPGSTKPTEKQAKSIKSISEVLRELESDLIKIDTKFAAFGGNIRKLPVDKIETIKNAIGELSELNVLPGNRLFDSLKSQIGLLQASLEKVPITVPVDITIPSIPSIKEKVVAQTAAAVKAGADTLGKQMNEYQKSVGQTLATSTKDAISGVSAAIGEAIVTGNAGGILAVFVNGIAGLLSNLGELLIIQGLGIEAFKNSLKSLQGIPAIVAGGAMIAASAAFRAAIPSFATGGGVFQPTMAMIGDNPGREEYVIPSEVLDKLGGGNSGFIAETMISGNDLRVLVRKADVNFNRING